MILKIESTTDKKFVGQDVEYTAGLPISIDGESIPIEMVKFLGEKVVLSNSNYVLICSYGQDN